MPTPFFAFQLSQYIFGPLLFLLSVFIILIILLQRGRGGGLTGALGGAGGSSAFGVKAGDIFTRITAVSVLLWICLCAFVCWWYLPETLDIEADPSVTTTSGAGALSIGPKEGEAIPAPPSTGPPSTGPLPAVSPLPAAGSAETPAPTSEPPALNLPAANLPPANLPAANPPAANPPAADAPAPADGSAPANPAGTSTEPKP
ncbi:preprotein translocase subunit SecG [Pirellulaceae bacterium SH467]